MTERSVTVRLIALTGQYDQAMRDSGKATADLGTAAELTGTRSSTASRNVDALGNSIRNADKASKDAKPSFSALGLSILTIGPALMPIGALAVGATGALVGMGATGLLAFGGIKKEMAAGTTLGQAYAGQLAILKGNLADLQHTAAAGLQGSFEEAVANVQRQMPMLSGAVSTFDAILGRTAVSLEDAFLVGLRQSLPLLEQVGVDVEQLVARFDAWSNGGGPQRFADWARAELPTIEHDLAAVASAVTHLVEGFAPLGVASLSELGMVAKAINMLPVGVLQQLIPLLVDGYLAFKAYQGLDMLVPKFDAFAAKLRSSGSAAVATSAQISASQAADTEAIDTAAAAQSAAFARAAAAAKLAAAVETSAMAAAAAEYVAASEVMDAALDREAAANVAAVELNKSAGAASGGMSALGGAVGGVTIALGVGLFAYQQWQQANQAARQMQDAFKQSLIDSKGAIDANVQSSVALQLQQAGLADKAAKAGISLSDLMTAVDGTDEQFAALLKTWTASGDPSAMTVTHLIALRGEFLAGQKAAQQYSDALATSTAKTVDTAAAQLALTDQLAQLAAKYGATTEQVQAFADQNKLVLDGTDKSSQTFITAANKATLLGSTLQQLKNDAIALTSPFNDVTTQVKAFTDALAQESTLAGGDVVRSHQTLQASLNSTATTLRDGKGAFDAFSTAGLAARSAIDTAAADAAKYAAAVFQQTGSVSAAVTAYDGWYQALVKTAGQQGVSKAALDAYLQSVGQLPGQVASALQGTQDAGTKAAAAMTDAMVTGLQTGLGPLESTLDNLIVTLGGSVAKTAGSLGMFLGGTVNSSMADEITADTQPESAATRKALRLALAADSAYASGEQVGTAYNYGLAAALASSPLVPGGSTYNSQVPSGRAPSFTAGSAGGFSGGFSAGTPAISSAGAGGGLSAAQQKVVAADDLLAAQALAALDPTDKLGRAQAAVADAVRRLNNETKAGSVAYYQDLEKLHQSQSALNTEIEAEAQARAQAMAKLATDTAAEADLQAQEIARTQQYYSDLQAAAAANATAIDQLMKQREASLTSTMDLTKAPVQQWADSIGFLVDNAKTELVDFQQWESDLAAARAAGLSDTAIQKLGLDAGPQADAQLKQILAGTPDQIRQLNATVAGINKAAADEANTEATNSYGALGQSLIAQQQQYAAAVIALQQQFAKDMASLAAQVKAAQATVSGDQSTIAGLPPQYQHIASPTALAGLPAGTALYTKNPDGTYSHIPDPTALAKLPQGTPIYDKLYDSGGLLPPGRTVAYNQTGKPEFVFTGDQLAAMSGGRDVTVVAQVVLDGKVISEQVTKHNASTRQQILVGGVRS